MSNQSQRKDKVFGRDDILGLPDPSIHKVHIDALDASVYMREITAADQERYEQSMFRVVDKGDGSFEPERDTSNMRSKYLVHVLCDADGNRIFGDEEYELIGKKRSDVIYEMHEKALELNGGTPKAQEDIKKDLDENPTDASSSG